VTYLYATILSGAAIFLSGRIFDLLRTRSHDTMDELSRIHTRNTHDYVRNGRWASAQEIREQCRKMDLPLSPHSSEQLPRN